jgi:hypothetical protein
VGRYVTKGNDFNRNCVINSAVCKTVHIIFNKNEIKMYSEGNLHVIINSHVNGFTSCHKYVLHSVLCRFFKQIFRCSRSVYEESYEGIVFW